MNKLSTLLLALFGLGSSSACSQAPYANADVQAFSEFIADDVQLLDVRTAAEYAEGHLSGAVNTQFYLGFMPLAAWLGG